MRLQVCPGKEFAAGARDVGCVRQRRGLAGENDFGREQRIPLAGGGVFSGVASTEFVMAVGVTDQFRCAKMGNNFCRCRNEPIGIS